jgi:osmotically-inducible protein OsmY
MRNFFTPVTLVAASAALCFAADPNKLTTFQGYADSDLCARLMLGAISPERIQCSQSTYKQGALPALVRLSDNLVFEVNKTKMLKEHVGELVEATGEPKEKDGRIKLESVKAIDAAAVPVGAPGHELLDARNFRVTGDRAKTFEKVRHELAMLPYISDFDFISFTMVGDNVILTGWTVRTTNRSSAYNIVKNIEAVDKITNNIDVLPMGSLDMQIRAGARAALQRNLSRYFWGNGSDIKIVVKNGNIILLGRVASQSDIDIAGIQCNAVPNAFHVFNLLKVTPSGQQKKQGG